jgi:hypothetical protein
MIQTMRAIARDGELSSNGRQALRQHCLDPLVDYLPPLVDLVRAEPRQNTAIETEVAALPTPTERGLLNATALVLRDPEEARRLLSATLNPARARRAEDLVAAMACALEGQCRERQRLAQARVRREQGSVH